MKLDPKTLATYQQNGYAVVPGVFTTAHIDRVRSMIFSLYRRFQPSDTRFDGMSEPWNDIAFDTAMIDLRKREPKTFGALYDCAQSSVVLMQLVADPGCIQIAADLLGDEVEDLSFSGLMLRMDAPEDKRNVLTWHQDRAYYPQNYNDGSRGLVYSVALQDITREMGALHICPGSHKEGLLQPEMNEKSDYATTEQRAVPAAAVARYPEVYGICKKGDVVLMNLDVFHRSGHNTSDRIRYSAIYRFHKMLADDYVPFGLLYQYNPHMIERAKALRGH